MNKLTKIGVSALCGSLAAIASAQAGEMAVAGGANATWSSNEGETVGNPIGMASNLTFTGSGELDNGTTFTLTVTHADQAAFSASQIALTTPSMGTFTIDNSGGGIDRLDDMMPTAWEEVDGTSLGIGLQTVAGGKGSTHVEWTLPSDMLPEGMSANILYAPRATGLKANDKASTGDGNGGQGSAWDVALTHSGLVDGLNAFLGYSTIEQAGAHADGDQIEKVIGGTYAVGGFTLGYQKSWSSRQLKGGAVTSYYENDAYAVSFSVNDNLSISYGVHKSDRVLNNATSTELDANSIQLAYDMGGATIKIAETSADDAKYVSGSANDVDATTVMLSLAF